MSDFQVEAAVFFEINEGGKFAGVFGSERPAVSGDEGRRITIHIAVRRIGREKRLKESPLFVGEE